MKEKCQTRITIRDYQTNAVKGSNFEKQRKMKHLTFSVPNGSNFSKLTDKCVHTWYTFLTNVVLRIL